MTQGGNGAECKILIIDDDVVAIRLLGGVLDGQAGIIFATSGESGIKLAAQHRPALILLDVEMPGMSGYEVCRELLNNPDTRDCAIILVTAHAGLESEVAALDAGAVDFITKPFNPPVVRARVRTHLRLQHQAAALAHLATTDGLTGLHNRRHFDQVLATEFERHQRQHLPLGLALIDIDHFKAYNDGYGHPAGDACLVAVATAIRAASRRPSEVVARYGGEEFAVVMPYTEELDAEKYGAWLCGQIRALQLPHAYSTMGQHVTVSVGLATGVPSHGSSSQQLVDAADCALYRAKAAGRDCHVLTADW
ncbi:MAG: diguanylate cyclase [Burkholderiales bacterium]|nr:diguanylate cyclase [Burkholderiales bacterium]